MLLSKKLYITDAISELKETIVSREKLFRQKNLEKKWQTATAEIVKTSEGESILNICGFEVMSDYQKP